MAKIITLSEEQARSLIGGGIDELKLYHGTKNSFDKFDRKFMSSGWGEQAYGDGFYFSTSPETAKVYARGGYILTVEVPNGKYLSYSRISRKEAERIAREFFTYFTTEGKGREEYKGVEDQFWNQECRFIMDCNDGGDVYGTINSITGSEKSTAAFLKRIGYVGLKYNSTNRDTGEKFSDYIIFDTEDIKILDRKKI